MFPTLKLAPQKKKHHQSQHLGPVIICSSFHLPPPPKIRVTTRMSYTFLKATLGESKNPPAILDGLPG